MVIVLKLYIGTVFEQQPHNLQRPIRRGHVQRGPAALTLRIYFCTMFYDRP
jgi:hypothetical protein